MISQRTSYLYDNDQLLGRGRTMRSEGKCRQQILVSTSQASPSNWRQTFKVTSTHLRVEYWDGTKSTLAASLGNVTLIKGGSLGAYRTAVVWPCDSSGNESGEILEHVQPSPQSTNEVDYRGCYGITNIFLAANTFYNGLDLSPCPLLRTLYFVVNPCDMYFLNVDLNTYLYTFSISNARTTELQLSSTGYLSSFPTNFGINFFASPCRKISLKYHPHGEIVSSYGSNTSVAIDVSYSNIERLYCVNNDQLESVRAVNCVFDTGAYKYKKVAYSVDFNNCSGLDAPNLDQFYTDLGPITSGLGLINVAGTAGASGDNPSIATSKGYAVFGT